MRYIISIKGDWKDLKLKLKNKYQSLTDADLEYPEEKYDQMIDHLEGKLHKTRQEFVRLLNRL